MKGDKIFLNILITISLFFIIIIFFLGFELYRSSGNVLRIFGINFILTSEWDPVKGVFGIAHIIFGTFITSFIALIIAVPLSLFIAYFINELIPHQLKPYFSSLVELLAAVPSVIYGLWALLILAPFLRENVYLPLQKFFGFIPFLQGTITGYGILTAGIVLSIMIIPTITSIIREALGLVPSHIKEAGISLGATQYQVAFIMFKYVKFAIIGAIILGFARAFGEAMAVAMIIGGKHGFPTHIFDSGYTLSSVIINEFTEAVNPLHHDSLIAIGFILFLIALANIIVARLLIYKTVGYVKFFTT